MLQDNSITLTDHVFCLSNEQVAEIKDQLYKSLVSNGLPGHVAMDFILQYALNSRLCDLVDTININDLKTIQVA